MATGQRIGYTRVSSLDQNTARQLDGVELDRVFTDKVSGKDLDRPQLTAMLEFVREGDTLYVHSLDRLARNLMDLRKLVEGLMARGVAVQFVKEALLFDGAQSSMAKLMLNMLGAVAEFERDMILERQREGIAIAKAKGVYKGRKKALTEAEAEGLRERFQAGESRAKLAEEYGIHRDSVYRYGQAV